ncbi:DedA family protein [Candidatus Wolfebacteria bacterium]|nr:DedA family protein [Candidatus Wolfebacteria bacterium]
MISLILESISSYILLVIQKIGYLGIFILMTLQSANIPIPSEVTMPFSGFLAGQRVLTFWLVVLAGTLGSLLGSLISYKLALVITQNGWIHKSRIARVIFSPKKLELAHRWFENYGDSSVFLGRLIPIVSTFISFPAGLARMKIFDFVVLTSAGAFIWSFILTWLGYSLGENWLTVRGYFSQFEYLIWFLIIILVIFWIKHRFGNNYEREVNRENKQEVK